MIKYYLEGTVLNIGVSLSQYTSTVMLYRGTHTANKKKNKKRGRGGASDGWFLLFIFFLDKTIRKTSYSTL